MHVRCDQRATGAARGLIAPWLGERVAAAVLATAQLLISELVADSVRHSGACETDLALVRVRLSHDTLALAVEDPGRRGVIARRSPHLECSGFGLNLVQSLSQRWGHERAALPGRTRVWAQLPLAAPTASAPGRQSKQPFVAEPSALATCSRPADRRAHATTQPDVDAFLTAARHASTPPTRGARPQPGPPAGTAALAPSQRRAAERRAALHAQQAIQRWLHQLTDR